MGRDFSPTICPAYHVGGQRFPYRSLQYIHAQSPNRQHGITVEQEEAMLRTASNMIIGAGQKLHMDHLAIATAVACLRRFYSVKSFLSNDYFVISIACLYLGGKVEDSPKSVKDVIYACVEWRYKKYQPETFQRLFDREFYDSAKERVFMAERALMYALNFDFNLSHPYEPFLDILKYSPVAVLRSRMLKTDGKKWESIAQLAMSLINDSIKTPLCLQYDGVKIGAAIVWLVLQLFQLNVDEFNPEGQTVWWKSVSPDLTPDMIKDIAMQLLSLYDLEQQQTADGEQQQHLYNMQDVMQGVQKGELFLSESSTITQGQFQRAVEGHTQRLASRPGSDIAGKKGLMHHANVQPSTESPFKQQRNYNAERRLDDADEEYNELFATANC